MGTIFCASVALVLATFTANGQSLSGTLLGTVTDTSSAVISSAKVTVTNEATNAKYTAATTGTGDFVVSNLALGLYSVAIESPGFTSRVVKGVTLLATRSARFDVTLDFGSVTPSSMSARSRTRRSPSGPIFNSAPSSSTCPTTRTWAARGRISRSPQRLAESPASAIHAKSSSASVLFFS